ncbi:MAG TPA: PHB depolymerase family esterase [Thermoanaerobaculia bacterium]
MSKKVVAAVMGVIALPAVLAVSEAVAFVVHNRTNGTIVSSGQVREYLLHVPPAYNASKPAPLVISMHGAGGWPVQQMETSGWNRVADQERFIVVYPAGAENGGPRIWTERDAPFIADLVDKLESSYNIDRHRIYANGLSNGGGMSFVLSCTMSDRLAAVGMVAAAQTLPWSWCKDRRPVPVIVFHGTADAAIPYNGGESWLSPHPFPSIPVWAEKWARRNRCAPRPVESAVASGVTLREYTGCANNATVAFYTLHGGGHSWPGGGPLPEFLVGPTSQSIDATRVMWNFFRDHRR